MSVVGCQHYEDGCVAMIESESFGTIHFLKENFNEYDKNAVKVLFTDDEGYMHHVGYVTKDQTKQVRKLIDEAKGPKDMAVPFLCSLDDARFKKDILQWFVVKVGPEDV